MRSRWGPTGVRRKRDGIVQSDRRRQSLHVGQQESADSVRCAVRLKQAVVDHPVHLMRLQIHPGACAAVIIGVGHHYRFTEDVAVRADVAGRDALNEHRTSRDLLDGLRADNHNHQAYLGAPSARAQHH
jgi:hypothetical protein